MAHIAVVEDELVIGTLLAMALEAHGETVERFETAEAFLASAHPRPFDLVLLDLNLPGMGGLDCLSLIRARGLAPGARMVMLTGSDESWDIARAHDLGAAGYLCKPFDAERLMDRLSRLIVDPSIVWMDDHHQVKAQGALPPRIAAA